jgi:diguanylate cyclase (GGDEF)-like protein
MTTYRFLRTETLQLSELQMQDLVNTPLEARFNRLARVAREALRVRAAAVSLIDREREWFKAVTGWYAGELPRSRSLAARLLEDGVPVIVADTRRDPRCREHPLVTDSPGFRFCAAYPLRDRFDNPIGALAGYDLEPHEPSARVLEVLNDVGEMAQRELFVSELGSAQQELLEKLDVSRRQAMLDELTRLWNRRGGLELLDRAMQDAHRGAGLGVCIVDVDRFKEINDTHGHATGDTVLRKVAGLLVDSVRVDDIACRLGGDEFLLVLPGITPADFARVVERIRKRTEAVSMRTRTGAVELTLSIGGFACAPGRGTTGEELLQRADEALYEAKASGRNRAVIAGAPRAA